MGKDEQLRIFTGMFCHMCKSFGFTEYQIAHIIRPIFAKEFKDINILHVTARQDH